MRKFAVLNIFFLAFVFLIAALCPVGEASVLVENGTLVKARVAEGKITQALITVTADGGPKLNTLQVDYPELSILAVTASLSVKKGSYKVELLENGRTSLTLNADGRKTAKGSGSLSVNATGEVQYRVLAKNAKDVVFELSFSPPVVPEVVRSSQAVSAGKSAEGTEEGLTLALTCLAGKDCRLQARNMSRTKAYRGILFQVDYSMLETDEFVEKSNGAPSETFFSRAKWGDWPIGLVFGGPPRDIKIKLVKAEEIDPATVTTAGPGRPQNSVRLLSSSDKQPKGGVVDLPVAQPGQYFPTSSQIISMRFFESGYGSLAHKQRAYAAEFVAADVRFINWELNLHLSGAGKKAGV